MSRRKLFGSSDVDTGDALGYCELLETLKAKLNPCPSKPLKNVPTIGADFVVVIDDFAWNLHKDQFAAKSDYFRVMTSSKFRVSTPWPM
jgi:hypothetical protein